jgi:hypothetical protein
MSELCSRHMTERMLDSRKLIVTYAYLPHDSNKPSPSRELRNVNTYFCRNNLKLIVGCDAKHTTLYGER